MMQYNEKYYHDGALWQLNRKPHLRAINTYQTKDGIIIGMFQGSITETDFIVRILKPGVDERPYPPPHIFWVVDLMLKIVNFRSEVEEILEFYIEFYKNSEPFKTPEARENYKLKTVKYISEKYNHIEQSFTLSLEYVAIIIELFCLNEKGKEGSFMFRELLNTLLNYTKNNVDYIQVMKAFKPY